MAALLLLGASVGALASDAPAFSGIGIAELQAVIDDLPEATTNDDVGRIRCLVGSPDTFDIAFEPTDDGSVHRRETWVYYDLGTAFEFVDGKVASAPRPRLLAGTVWSTPSTCRGHCR